MVSTASSVSDNYRFFVLEGVNSDETAPVPFFCRIKKGRLKTELQRTNNMIGGVTQARFCEVDILLTVPEGSSTE